MVYDIECVFVICWQTTTVYKMYTFIVNACHLACHLKEKSLQLFNWARNEERFNKVLAEVLLKMA